MKLGAVIPCHNEASLLPACLDALHGAGASRNVVVVDRCSDSTREAALRFPHDLIVEKRLASWRNSTAENIELGFRLLLDRDYVAVIGADTIVPRNFWGDTVGALEADPTLASVSGVMHSGGSAVYRSYELVLEKVGLEHGIRSSGRVYKMSLIRRLLFDRLHVLEQGFIGEDSKLDDDLGGRKVVLPEVRMTDVRPWSLRKSVRGQFQSGRARRELRRPFRRSLGEVPRLRPFVLLGWLLGRPRAGVPRGALKSDPE